MKRRGGEAGTLAHRRPSSVPRRRRVISRLPTRSAGMRFPVPRGSGCGGYRPDDRGWGRGSRPVIRVSWSDVQAYVAWLSGKTGEAYRLLSEAEWEYAARAGTTTRYHWGDDIGRNRVILRRRPVRGQLGTHGPGGSFGANGFGLHDMHGNVWEWVEDC